MKGVIFNLHALWANHLQCHRSSFVRSFALGINPTENMKKVIATHHIFVKFRIVLFIVKWIFYKKKKKKHK